MANKADNLTGVYERKAKGRVYTPEYMVKSILNMAHYTGEGIVNKHVIDNSCGDGAFLTEIVRRYCEAARRKHSSTVDLIGQLETYIHGIEIEASEHLKCLKNLNSLVAEYGIDEPVAWDILCSDAMAVDKYNGKMDFVLGNPPYIRVHNLESSLDAAKQFSFAQGGMTDLYIVFYEIGLRMLNSNGVLGYITPSSFFNSLAGSYMRQYFVRENVMEALVDLKHFQAFPTTTYTTIVVLNKQHRADRVAYYQFDEKSRVPYHVETLTSNDYYIAGNFYFSTKANLLLLKKIFFNSGHCDIEVKNGYATLCDEVFVGSFPFESSYIIPVVKASRGEVKQMVYPYNENGKLVAEEDLAHDEQVYEYLLKNKAKLAKRSSEHKTESCWFAFGRSQAINDTYKNKIAINTLLRTSSDLKIVSAPAGTGVYSGLYLIGNDQSFSNVGQILLSEEFSVYVSLLGKYKSGGYYTFSSKDVKAYLDYKLAYKGGLAMTTNEEFLESIKQSFSTYLAVGTSRSTAKLKTLHGHIASDLKSLLGDDFTIKSQGYGNDKEKRVDGRYYPKNVDITVLKNNKPVAGYAVKFVMRNYSQNSNNYFENMLGETANIRANAIPYFQIFICFDKVPYYKKGDEFKRYDVITEHNLNKYIALSKDNPNVFFHTPDKTLVALVKLKEKEPDYRFRDFADYAEYYRSVIADDDVLCYSDKVTDSFDSGVILNDYEDFLTRTYHIIMGNLKN